jgi:DNA mismatch repair ATPase MutS
LKEKQRSKHIEQEECTKDIEGKTGNHGIKNFDVSSGTSSPSIAMSRLLHTWDLEQLQFTPQFGSHLNRTINHHMGSGDLMQTSLEFVPELRVVNSDVH